MSVVADQNFSEFILKSTPEQLVNLSEEEIELLISVEDNPSLVDNYLYLQEEFDQDHNFPEFVKYLGYVLLKSVQFSRTHRAYMPLSFYALKIKYPEIMYNKNDPYTKQLTEIYDYVYRDLAIETIIVSKILRKQSHGGTKLDANVLRLLKKYL